MEFDQWWYEWLSQRQAAGKPQADNAARAAWHAALTITRPEELSAIPEVTAAMVDAADKYYRESLGYCIHGRNDFAGIWQVMAEAAMPSRETSASSV